MNSEEIHQEYGQEIYLFILKKVKNKPIANDIFQNTFLKIHKNINQLKANEKARSWAFQICRNEIVNFFNKEPIHTDESKITRNVIDEYKDICCFDRFIDELPKIYKEVIELTFINGIKQKEVAETLGISVANVKARIRRSKMILKERFLKCCKYEVSKKGKLIGTPNCLTCC